MRKNLLWLFFTLLTLASQGVLAQGRTVTGQVTGSDGSGLPGVTVVLQGTTNGASTDANGNYSLNVPANGGTLVFSSIGFVTQQRVIGSETRLNVALVADNKQLDEIVVTALGLTERKDEQGVATAKVSGAAVVQSGETSVITGLSGKASGVQVTRTGGDPGAGAYIQIRGQNTITGSTQPLIVIDGVPANNSTVGSGVGGVVQQSRLNDINPNDIASMQILKGAAAAALWGSRAANGVIVITTKRGETENGKISVTYGATYSLDKISYKHDLQDSYGRGIDGVAALGTSSQSFSWGDKIANRSGGPDQFATTGPYFQAADGSIYYPITQKNSQETYLDKNFDEIFQTGHFLEHSLSLSAGDRNGNVYLSLSDLDQEGIIRYGSDYRRTTGRINAEKRFNKVLRLAGNSTFSRVNSNRIQQGSNTSGLYLGYVRQAPDFDQEDYIGTYYDAAGAATLNRQRSYRQQIGQGQSPIYNNPLWTVQEQKNPSQVNRFVGNVELGVDPFSWLGFTARIGADTYTDNRRTFFPKGSAENAGLGSATERTLSETQLNADFFGRASHAFSNKFSGNILVGMNLNQRQYNNIEVSYINFINDERELSYFANASKDNTTATDYESKRRNSAGYTTLGVSFNEQLFLNASGRLENASTFGRETKNVFFYPSADLAWQFSRLAPLADNRIFSFGKLRVAYGEVGLEPPVYVTRDIYINATNTESFGPSLNPSTFGGSFARTDLRGNPSLRPERKREVETGLDLRFLQDRIALNLTYYQNQTTDAILPVPVPASSGYTSEYANAATLRNRGVEVDLNATVVKGEDFTWNVGGNWTRNRNRVVDLAGAESIFLNGFTGVSSRAVKDQPVGVLWGGRFDTQDNGAYVLDANGFPQAATTEGVIGNPNPKWRSGINTTFQYKGVRLYALVETSFGGDIWAGTEGVLRYFGTSQNTAVETTLPAAQAQTTKISTGRTVAQAYKPNADGSYTFRGRVEDFGAGPVALDQSWYTNLGGGFGPVGSQFIQDATWTRLRELTLSYNLATAGFRKTTRLSNVELTLTGRNLLLYTKEFKGVDPETNLTGPSNGRGLEYFNNPGTRSYLFGIRVTY